MSTASAIRGALAVAAALVWAPAAGAAPAVSIEAPALLGQAPFDAFLTARGDADSFNWDFGDGTTATGRSVTHRFATGRYTVTVTASGGGETAQAAAVVTAATLSLAAPRSGTFGRRVPLRGRLLPAMAGAAVELLAGGRVVGVSRTDGAGRFRFRATLGRPAAYTARFGPVASAAAAPTVRPRIVASIPTSILVGRRFAASARLLPADGGRLELRVWRNGRRWYTRSLAAGGRFRLPAGRPAAYVVQLVAHPATGFARAVQTIRTSVYVPFLAPSSRGASVRMLEARLAQLRYALRGADGYYGTDTYEAVLAFQKVNGLARTGRVGPALWRRLQHAQVPRARYHGPFHHIEIDRRRQVLFEVRGGSVTRVVHVSTGATGNTPLGRWRVYSKVPGTLPTGMYYSSFFVGAFAIHGYPSVPAYPASHGCVRIPMWIAPRLFARTSYGQTVYIYV